MSPLHRYILAVFAALFVCIQTGALMHATQHGDNPHSHDGVLCEIEAISSELTMIEPALPVDTSYYVPISTDFETVFVSAAVTPPPGRAPPPRSPPYSSF